MLQKVHDGIFQIALDNRTKKTYNCASIDEIISCRAEHGDGFILAPWCGDEACEDGVKEQTGVTSRCIPLDDPDCTGKKCVCCGKEAQHMVYWAIAY